MNDKCAIFVRTLTSEQSVESNLEEFADCTDCGMRVRHHDPEILRDMTWHHERINGCSSGWDYDYEENWVVRTLASDVTANT